MPYHWHASRIFFGNLDYRTETWASNIDSVIYFAPPYKFTLHFEFIRHKLPVANLAMTQFDSVYWLRYSRCTQY